MTKHLICITIDIDPDGFSGVATNRNSSSFESFKKLQTFPDIIQQEIKIPVPITWFIRIDDQINYFFGNRFYLIEKFQNFWDYIGIRQHELAWHPHIYQKVGNEFVIPADLNYSCDR